MYSEPLDVLPVWALLVAACLFIGLAMEGGYRLGRWRHARAAEEKESPVGAMVGSILGLLAFLLAFTFGLAASRFDERRKVVLEEANAIGTTWLRAKLLPEALQKDKKDKQDEKGEKDSRGVLRLLKDYVDERISGVREGRVAEAVEKSEELHALLWRKAVVASKSPESHPVMTSLFIQSLNQMIDLHAVRLQVGARNRIPISIWLGLFTLALLGMGAVGYQSGLAATRRSPAMLGLVLAFAGVLYLIADLDRGQEGFLVVSQQALIDVQKSMHEDKD